MSGSDPKPTTSDAELIESARSGDTSAFSEPWRRHFRPAARAARQFTSIDADDLVSEAYARIFQRVLTGGGPTMVAANGMYSVSVGGIRQAVGSLSVVQTVNQSLIGGLLGGVLVNLQPLTVSSSSGRLPVVAAG